MNKSVVKLAKIIRVSFYSIAFLLVPAIHAQTAQADDYVLPAVDQLYLDSLFTSIKPEAVPFRIDRLIREDKPTITERFSEAAQLVESGTLLIADLQAALFPEEPLIGYVFYLYDSGRPSSEKYRYHTVARALARANGWRTENTKSGHGNHHNPAVAGVYKRLRAVIGMKQYRDGYFHVLGEYAALVKNGRTGPETSWILGGRSDSVGGLPKLSDLQVNHKCCVDVFFRYVDSTIMLGPEVDSIFGGIVISAGRDWKGTKDLMAFEGGGTLPERGNAIVIYNPARRQIAYYGHIYDGADQPIPVTTGDLVLAGQAIGRGGASGQNALERLPHSDKHVHFELHFVSAEGVNSGELPERLAFPVPEGQVRIPAHYTHYVLSGGDAY